MKLTIKIMTIKGCRFEISFGEGLPKGVKGKQISIVFVPKRY